MWNNVIKFDPLKGEGLPSFLPSHSFAAAWNEDVMAGASAAILDQEIMHGSNKIEGPWTEDTIEPPYHLRILYT